MKLTEDQKKKQGELRKALGALNKEINGKLMKLLTKEQLATLKESRKKGKGKKQAGKKTEKKTAAKGQKTSKEK